MGKPYDHRYFFKGSGCRNGEMKCAECGKHIDENIDDWVGAKKSKAYSWYFITHHRRCYRRHDGWAVLESKRNKAMERRGEILTALKHLADKYSIDDAYSFADLAANSLGADL